MVVFVNWDDPSCPCSDFLLLISLEVIGAALPLLQSVVALSKLSRHMWWSTWMPGMGPTGKVVVSSGPRNGPGFTSVFRKQSDWRRYEKYWVEDKDIFFDDSSAVTSTLYDFILKLIAQSDFPWWPNFSRASSSSRLHYVIPMGHIRISRTEPDCAPASDSVAAQERRRRKKVCVHWAGKPYHIWLGSHWLGSHILLDWEVIGWEAISYLTGMPLAGKPYLMGKPSTPEVHALMVWLPNPQPSLVFFITAVSSILSSRRPRSSQALCGQCGRHVRAPAFWLRNDLNLDSNIEHEVLW